MRRLVLAALLTACASAALAEPTPKEQLLVPPGDAAHFVVVSTAGKHGDEYMWKLADGRVAFRESILLRGLIFETDETLRLGADGMPADLVVRGVTPTGDAAENFSIGNGKASWVSTVDKGDAPYASPAYYLPQGGPFLSTAPQIDALLTAGNAGMALLPSGKATFEKVASLDVDGSQGTKHVDLILLKGTSQSPQPVWVENGKFFGLLSGLGLLPAGYEGNLDKLQAAQDKAIAALVLATECFDSVIVDQKGPLVAQGSLAVTSLDETLAAVRKIKANNLTAVKFYTSMNPAWIAPAAKLAHQLGLHVHGHIPAGMRTLDAINAGYDEITHIYFATMQAMPAEVVAKSNTTLRMLGPGKYFKDVDLDAEPTRTAIKTMADKHIVLDPTLVVV